jgi:hypothetical protein
MKTSNSTELKVNKNIREHLSTLASCCIINTVLLYFKQTAVKALTVKQTIFYSDSKYIRKLTPWRRILLEKQK